LLFLKNQLAESSQTAHSPHVAGHLRARVGADGGADAENARALSLDPEFVLLLAIPRLLRRVFLAGVLGFLEVPKETPHILRRVTSKIGII